MGAVTLRNLEKAFGAVKVLQGIDINIREGEFVALVGPSGCGKSTLLRIIAGLEDATAGDIEIGGKPVNDLSPRDRNIAMVFQSYALYPHMNVGDNMSFNLKLSGVPKQVIRERVAEAARMLDLTNLLDRKPSQLSGGQRQRVAMGRAIVRQPSAFLFDEPLSNLDAKLRVQMRTEIKALHQKVKTTSIYVTHDQIEAMTLADRIVVLNGGRIAQEGSPLELYRRPANRFVATFIGSPAMNMLNAIVDEDAGRLFARFEDGSRLLLPEANIGPDQDIVIGIRPEAVDLASTENRIKGTINVIEPTGAQTYLMLDIGGQPFTLVVDGSMEFNVGQQLTFSAPCEQLHVFDAKSEARLNVDDALRSAG
jgi:multiple sugar transport system ATP-binding protein